MEDLCVHLRALARGVLPHIVPQEQIRATQERRERRVRERHPRIGIDADRLCALAPSVRLARWSGHGRTRRGRRHFHLLLNNPSVH